MNRIGPTIRPWLQSCHYGLMALMLVTITHVDLALAQQEPKVESAPAPKAAPAPEATHKVKKGPFRIEVNLTGVFESQRMSPVLLRPEKWSSFTIEKVVYHGQRVKKGESLVTLDMTDIDSKLQDLEYTFQLSGLSRQLAETELKLLQTTLPLDLEAAARSKRIADEDLSYFLKTNKSFQEESAKFSLKSSQDSLEYAEEELKQLEKMYNADDLTEETEEIVLKRARNDVERSKFYLKSSEVRTNKTLTQDIARQEKQLNDAAKRAELALTKARVALPNKFEKQQIEREKQKVTDKRAKEDHDQLLRDRALMAVKSPADGYVYYGECKRGKWSGLDSTSSQLRPGGKLSSNSVFMTIVEMRPMHIRVDIPEKELHRLQPGISGKATANGYPNLELETTLERVSSFPVGSEIFDGQFGVKLTDDAKPIVPGMKCKLTMVAYDKQDVISVPASAVFRDDTGERTMVYVKTGEGQSERRKVAVGQKTEQKWEITAGLQPGDEILLKEPDQS